MTEPSMLQVVAMGLITVFLCLIALIIIIKLMGFIINKATPAAKETAAVAEAAPVVQAASAGDRQQLIAVAASVIAEDMGVQISHLRIHSMKRK